MSKNLHDEDLRKRLAKAEAALEAMRHERTRAEQLLIDQISALENRTKQYRALMELIPPLRQATATEAGFDNQVQKLVESLKGSEIIHAAWIALTDESEFIRWFGGCNGGESNEPVSEPKASGKGPSCLERILAEPELVVLEAEDPLCRDCPLFNAPAPGIAVVARLEFNDTVFGAQMLRLDPDFLGDENLTWLLKEIASQLGYGAYQIQLEAARKKTISALRESDYKFRSFFNNSRVGMLIWDTHDPVRYVAINEKLAALNGRPVEEHLGKTIADVFDAEKVDLDHREPLRNLLQTKKPVTLESSRLSQKGDRVHFITEYFPLTDSDGGLTGIGAVVIDITTRVQAETSLQERQHFLQKILDTEPRFVYIYDFLKHSNVFVNRHWLTNYGYSAEEIEAMGNDLLANVLHADDLVLVEAQHDAWRRDKETDVRDVEFRIRTKEGELRWLLSREAVFTRDDSGKVSQILGIANDITKRVHAEQEISECGQLLTEMSRMAKIGGWEFDPLTLKGTWTEEVARIHDLDPDNETNVEIGISFYEGESRRLIESAVQRSIEQGEPYELELEMLTAKGKHKWVRTIGRPVMEGGRVVKVRGTIQDITEKKQAREMLLISQRRLALALEATGAGIFDYTLPLDAGTYHSERWAEILGYRLEELPSHDAFMDWYYQQIHPEDLERYDQAYIDFAEGRTRTLDLEVRIRNKSGEWVHTQSLSQAVSRDAEGRAMRIVGVLMDVTDHHLLEAQFRQSQKMEAVGRLAGGVAHDFNNLLSVINVYADLTINHLSDSDPVRADIGEIRKASQRAIDLTRQLLAFARQQTVAPKVLNLNELIRDSENMLRRLAGEDIELRIVTAPDLWTVNMDSSQIDQILANLTVNSRDAIDGVGIVIIETSNVSMDPEYCRLHNEFTPGQYVLLTASDNGSGMDRETQANIFEPFFSTKEESKGTGLGLSTVYGIVRQNQGYINVYSEPGQGTTFRIYLPRFEGKAERVSKQEGGRLSTGTETILVVEDEEQILKLCKAVLEHKGYTVIAADKPREALAICESYGEEIHLLITDVIMPSMSGKDLKERVEMLKPDIKVLYMSGYTAKIISQRGVLAEGVHFIQKPFTLDGLAQKVREVLDK